MNSKKAALFLLMSVVAFPAITSATPSKNGGAVSPVKHVSAGLFSRIVTPWHKKQAVVTDKHGNRKDFGNKTH